jgi:hypothetical protein
VNPETLLAALLGASIASLALAPVLASARSQAKAAVASLLETQGIVANLRRDLTASESVASTLRAGKQRCEERLEQAVAQRDQARKDAEEATRYAGWKGVYTKPDGTEVNVVGVGPCTLKPGRVVVENADKAGSTVFDVDAARVRWEG